MLRRTIPTSGDWLQHGRLKTSQHIPYRVSESQSQYCRRRARVRKEVFGGAETGAHRSGTEGAVAAVLGFAAAAYTCYFFAPGFASGALLGACAPGAITTGRNWWMGVLAL